jgi:hypothetical protein
LRYKIYLLLLIHRQVLAFGVKQMKWTLKKFLATMSMHLLKNTAAKVYLESESIGRSIQLHRSYSPLLVRCELIRDIHKILPMLKRAALIIAVIGFLTSLIGAYTGNVPAALCGVFIVLSASIFLFQLNTRIPEDCFV